MKIELKLSAKQLSALVFQFKSLNEQCIQERSIKVARSILDKLVLRLKTKHLQVDKLPTKNKKGSIIKYKFSIDYHEAHYLEKFVEIALNFPTNEYDRNVLNFIKDNLNQQLA